LPGSDTRASRRHVQSRPALLRPGQPSSSSPFPRPPVPRSHAATHGGAAPRAPLDGGCCEARGDLTGLGAPHPVGDREERRFEDVRILVVATSPPRMRQRRSASQFYWSYLKAVSPTRITSPGSSLLGCVSLTPFTKVPFVEPRSSNQTPSRLGSMRAC